MTEIGELVDAVNKQNILMARILYAVGTPLDRIDMVRMFPGYAFKKGNGTFKDQQHRYTMENICLSVHAFLQQCPDEYWNGTAEQLRDALVGTIPAMPVQEIGCVLGRLVKPAVMKLYHNVWSIKGEKFGEARPTVWKLETHPKLSPPG